MSAGRADSLRSRMIRVGFLDSSRGAEAFERLGGWCEPLLALPARTADPESNGGQFFVVYEETQLPTDGGGYSVFGRVTEGLDIVEAIAAAGAEGGAPDGPPAQPVSILSVEVDQG